MSTITERMQEVTQVAVGGKPRIALDTCCVQYYISDPPVQPWADCLDPVFHAAVAGKIELYISTVVVSELLAHVHFANRHTSGYDPELDLLTIMNRWFQVLDVTVDIAREAGRLRGGYIPGNKIALKTPDALIGATSLTSGHSLFITNDAQLSRALPQTNCIYLRDVALEWLTNNFPSQCCDVSTSVSPSKSGKGLPTGASIASLELGSIRPDPSATWKRILKDAQTAASAVNEPCMFFVLAEKNGRKMETREVLFWQESLMENRPPRKLIKRLQDHLGYSAKTGIANNFEACIHGFMFASLVREKARQDHPGLASKSNHQKNIDAWNNYLALLRIFRSCLDLPRTTWLLCEDGGIHVLNVAPTVRFLDQVTNVLGWQDDK